MPAVVPTKLVQPMRPSRLKHHEWACAVFTAAQIGVNNRVMNTGEEQQTFGLNVEGFNRFAFVYSFTNEHTVDLAFQIADPYTGQLDAAGSTYVAAGLASVVSETGVAGFGRKVPGVMSGFVWANITVYVSVADAIPDTTATVSLICGVI